MTNMLNPELEWKAEGEYEDEGFGDQELEDEQFLGGLIKGIGNVLGLGDGEYESEDEGLGSQEYEDEYEDESEYESEYEDFGDQEYEDEGFSDPENEGEPFLPALLPIAKMALPLIGGLFRKRKRSREAEFEDFSDQEYEDEQFLGGLIGGLGKMLGLGEGEFEDESFFEVAQNAGVKPPVMAEVLAAMASEAQSEAEAEALVGAATVMTLSPREQRTLERSIPQILRAMAILTKLLRRRRGTQPVIRVVPSLVKATAVPVVRAALRGHPPTTSIVGRVLTRQTRTVLTKPGVTRVALGRNASSVRRAVPRTVGSTPTSARRRAPGRRLNVTRTP